jgi:hypothetical protein
VNACWRRVAAPAGGEGHATLNYKKQETVVNNLNLARGLCLIAVSLAFGMTALQYRIGDFSKAGPGLFPFLIASLLFLIGVLTVVRSRFVKPEPIKYNLKNIALVLLGLCGFAAISHYLNMIAGIIFLVFVVSFCGTNYSVVRNIKIAAGLLAVAFMFRHLLGLNLPLF